MAAAGRPERHNTSGPKRVN